MPEIGSKYESGGQRYLCIGVDMSAMTAILACRGVVVPIPLSAFHATFKKVGAIQKGDVVQTPVAYGKIQANKKYTVVSVNGDAVYLDNGESISLPVFANLFPIV